MYIYINIYIYTGAYLRCMITKARPHMTKPINKLTSRENQHQHIQQNYVGGPT